MAHTKKSLARQDLFGFLKKRGESLARPSTTSFSQGTRDHTLPFRRNARWLAKLAEDGMSAQYASQNSKVLDIDESTMSVGFRISSSRRDRHGDVVIPKGCVGTLEDYARNPCVFFAHMSHCLPIASARKPGTQDLALWLEEDDIFSRGYFHGKTQESEDVFSLIVSGDLRSTSIGFLPIHAEIIEGTYDERDQSQVDFDMGGLVFDEWSLLEWSVVPVPANPDATRAWLSRAKGGVEKSLVRKVLQQQLPAPRATVSVPRTISSRSSSVRKPHTMSVTKDPTAYQEDPVAEATEPQGDKHKKEDIQALIFHPERFPEHDQVVQWLEENGYSSEHIHPGEEADEPCVAIQFAAEECDLTTAKREEMEPGVQCVTCVRNDEAEEAPDYDDHGATDSNPQHMASPIGNSFTLPPWAEKSLQEKKLPRVLADELAEEEEDPTMAKDKKRKPDEEDEEMDDSDMEAYSQDEEEEADMDEPDHGHEGDDEVSKDDMDPDDDEVVRDDEEDEEEVTKDEEEEGDEKPYGAQVLHKVHGHLKEIGSHLHKAVDKELLEHEGVKKYLGGLKEALEGHMCELQDFAKETYPKHFKDMEGTSPGDDGGKGGKDRPGSGGDASMDEDSKKKPETKKKPKKALASSHVEKSTKMSRKDVGVIREAAEFMEELSEEAGLKRSHKAASRHHASNLQGLADKHDAGPDAQGEEPDTKAMEAALKKLVASQAVLVKRFETLTGTEV